MYSPGQQMACSILRTYPLAASKGRGYYVLPQTLTHLKANSAPNLSCS